MEQKKMISLRLRPFQIDGLQLRLKELTGIDATKTEIVELALDLLSDKLVDIEYFPGMKKGSALLDLYRITKNPLIKDLIEEEKKKILENAKK